MQDTVLADAVPGGVYEGLRKPSEQVSASELARIAWRARDDSLVEILDRGEPVPKERFSNKLLI